MSFRHLHTCLLALALLAFALPARAEDPPPPDELADLDDGDDKAAETEEPASEPVAADAAAARAAQAGDAAAAFAADSPGVDADTMLKARAHFEQGVEFYSEGDYRAALIELQRAYELHRTYKLLYNLGQVAYELRDYAGAERYFRDYLAKGGEELSPERRREIKQELARLRSRVATLRVSANQPDATLRVDDHVIQHPQGEMRVSAGRRVVRGDKAGFSPVERVVDVTGGESLNVQLNFGPPLLASGGDAAAQASSSRLPWVTGIMSGVLLVASGAVGWAAYQDVSSRDDALRQYTTRGELDSLGAQAHTKAIVADALLGAALVSAAVTVVVVLASGGGGKPDSKPAQIPHVRATPALVTF
ncbi:MAG TPA: tetratricopeptide repeat protein [Polyangiales bacterium]|jgi:tetratricopeptide (TPR) repeat protein|nr:tetratricopeptide repeat protein [Polyangiales bacterium]